MLAGEGAGAYVSIRPSMTIIRNETTHHARRAVMRAGGGGESALGPVNTLCMSAHTQRKTKMSKPQSSSESGLEL
jgi:hypothetical protein